MTKEILYCTVLDNVYEAAVKMKDGNVGAIPVVLDDGLELVGIVTDRDLVLRGSPLKTKFAKITNVMTTDLITVSEDDSIEKAVDLMGDYQIRRVPVTRGKTLAGIITLGDVSTHKNQTGRLATR